MEVIRFTFAGISEIWITWDLHLQPSSCLSLLSVNLQSIVSTQSARHQGKLMAGRNRCGMERIIYTYWAKHAQYFAQIILSLKQKCLLKPVSFLPPFNSLASQHSQLDRENYALRLVTTLCVLYPRLTFAFEHESFIFRWNHQTYFSAVLLTKPLTHELRSVLVAFHPYPPFWSRPV